MAGKTRNIAIQLILQQCCKTTWMFFAGRFSVPIRRTDKGAKLENKLIYHATGEVSNGDAYTRSFLIHLYVYRALQKKNSRGT